MQNLRFFILFIVFFSLLACSAKSIKHKLILPEKHTHALFQILRQSPLPTTTPLTAQLPIVQIDSGGHLAGIIALTFTPDGHYLVSAGNDKLIRVWDLKTKRTVKLFRGQIGKGNIGKIYAMALSPNGQWLAVGGWIAPECTYHCGGIRLYDFTNGQLVGLLKGHTQSILSLAFSPDSRFLVSGSSDKTASLWDVKRYVNVHTLRGHSDAVSVVAFTPDGQRIVTGSNDQSLRLWHLVDGKVAILKGHTDKISGLAISPLDGNIASSSYDHTLRLWNGQTGQFIKVLAELDSEIGRLAFSSNGRFLVAGNGSSLSLGSHIWSMPEGKKTVSYSGHNNSVIAIAVSPDSHWVATGSINDKTIHIWSVGEGSLIERLHGTGETIWAVAFSAEGQTLAWGKTPDYFSPNPPLSRGPLEYMMTLPTSKTSLGQPVTFKTSPTSSVLNLFSDRFLQGQDRWGKWSLRLRTGGYHNYQDGILDIYNKNHKVASIERHSTNGYRHRAYTFTVDGQHIISGGANGVLISYNREGIKLGEYVGHTSEIWAVAVSPDNQLLASASEDQTVRLWSLHTRELLLTLFHASDGEWIAWTPMGHYTGSLFGDRKLGWQINRGINKSPDYITAAQLHGQLYRPDIVNNAIRFRSVRRAIAQAGNIRFKLEQLINPNFSHF